MKIPMHGANPTRLYEAFDMEIPDKIIDFSTNTSVLDFDCRFEMSKEHIEKYPDPKYKKLVNSLKDTHQCSGDNILVTNGANEGIYLIASEYAGKTIGIVQPAYPEYEKAFKAYGVAVVEVFDLECIDESIDLVVMSNPNNPTGKLIKDEVLNRIIEKSGADWLIDESYRDFVSIDDGRDSGKKTGEISGNRLIVLRSFTKIYKMAGLRCGYVLAGESMINKLRDKQPTWSVGGMLEDYLIPLIEDQSIIQETKAYYKTERDYVFNRLKHNGFVVNDSVSNFFLIDLKKSLGEEVEPLAVIRFLLEGGIVVRHTFNYRLLEGDFIRIGLRSRSENEQLIERLARYKITYSI